MRTKLQQLIDLHASLVCTNPYCYFELAYTRTTGWMAWICTNHPGVASREVLARGSGDSPEAAANAAIDYFVQ